jgi:translocator protein
MRTIRSLILNFLVAGAIFHTSLGFHVQNNVKYLLFTRDAEKVRPNVGIGHHTFQRNNNNIIATTTLCSSDSPVVDSNEKEGEPPSIKLLLLPAAKSLDIGAILRYDAAFIIQMILFAGVFLGLDALKKATQIQSIPFAMNVLFFYGCALKSRVLNPLNNQRPNPATKEITITSDDDPQAPPPPPPRIMPSWTPAGFIFPIVWLLIIGPIRAVSSALVYQKTGCYFCTAIMTLMAHLSIGDIWNTINNKERRYGTSVVGVLLVWASAALATYQYSLVTPLAGRLLSLPLIWLTIASSLIIRTWQLNPVPDTGKPDSFLPTKTAGTNTITKLEWFEK